MVTVGRFLLLLVGVAFVEGELRASNVRTTALGTDPEGSARLNGMSFQQDAIVSYKNWQYVAFYDSTGTYNAQNIALGRRNITNPSSPSSWEILHFTDYVQRTQDSHNTISLGISPSDGRIHLSYDHHDVPLNYRVSNQGIASDPGAHAWSASLFGTTLHALPGAGSGPWTPVTYPRFERAGDSLLFEMRIGQSGAGDSYLYQYSSNSWSQLNRYIHGTDNNAYINGIEFFPATSSLHTTWTWRETPDVVTNHDLCYAYSPDLGRTWYNNAGQSIGSTITPTSNGINVFNIPQNSGILNQEAQVLDALGQMHVLNREFIGGTLTWLHYFRSSSGAWAKKAINHSLGPLTQTGRRGKLAAHPNGDIVAILASNTGNDLAVMSASPSDGFATWTELWRGQNFDVEPLYDRELWRGRGGLPAGKRLSLFLNTAGSYPSRKVEVVDLEID